MKDPNAPDEVKEVRVVGGGVEFFSEHDHRSGERGQERQLLVLWSLRIYRAGPLDGSARAWTVCIV